MSEFLNEKESVCAFICVSATTFSSVTSFFKKKGTALRLSECNADTCSNYALFTSGAIIKSRENPALGIQNPLRPLTLPVESTLFTP